MKPVSLHLHRIGFAAPRIEGWAALEAALRSGEEWRGDPDWTVTPACLSPRAAKRLSPQIRLALTVAEQLGELRADAGYVFASCIGEGETLKVILDALRTDDMLVQPLRFQNAVHNAAVGQWTIAARHHGPATSIAAMNETVGAGLLKCAMQVAAEGRDAGLVCFDVPLPRPLHPAFPMDVALGAGFAFSVEPTDETLATLVATMGDSPPTPPRSAVARAMVVSGNPVASALPLLEALAEEEPGAVTVALNGGRSLTLEITRR